MSDHNDKNNKFLNNDNIIKFKVDKPFRMFVGEIEGNTIKKISTEELEGFKDGDKAVVMHGEDWLWFIDELLKHQMID
jgi:trans-2-enoyl-CoA reductase